MTLAERLAEYVRACFTGLWVQSFEHQDALAEIAGLCRTHGWSQGYRTMIAGIPCRTCSK
jgi:hypothetical protein